MIPVSIGIHTFHDSESRTTLIYDWRVPISSMFYDHELGEATYLSPSGEIKGAVSLKRQYKIRGGNMEFMIESALTVHDDILQKELSSNTDDKMKNIVATIQREQNRIIRNEDARTLIIQGVAGSGKTSIALHRIAYLLYAFKGSISSKDILIISPNKVFADYILDMMKVQYASTVTTAERNLLKKEIKKMFAGNNDIQAYTNFFEWMEKSEMFKMRKNRTLEYADLAPVAYLHIALEGNSNIPNSVKHLLIDEMQDYSPIQYKVIQKLFPCRKTVLGDASQSVNPYGSSNADMIRKALVTGEVMKLCKSYRSTYEITDFAQKIRSNAELEPVARHGEKPQVLQFNTAEEEFFAITNWISTYRKSTHKSLGIICKTETQARELADKLKPHGDDIYFLSSQSSAFVQGLVITSAHMAKGLEFDEVIIPQVDDKNYHSEIDRSMLYVAVTRAMHRLTLTYSGTKHSPFKKAIQLSGK